MNHKVFEEYLFLYLIDELGDNEKLLLLNHLKECSACTQKLQEDNKLNTLYDNYKTPIITDNKLSTLRSELRTRIKIENEKKNSFSKFLNSLNFFLLNNYKPALSYSVILFIGLFIGILLKQKSTTIEIRKEPYAVDKVIEKIVEKPQIVYVNKGSDRTKQEQKVKETSPNLNLADKNFSEDNSRQFSFANFNQDNAGKKLDLLNNVYKSIGALEPEVQEAILNTAKKDPNPGVRRQAIDLLSKVNFDDKIKQTMFYVLKTDSIAGNRINAMMVLVAGSKLSKLTNDDLEIIKNNVMQDKNSYVRLQASLVLKEYEL